jgi:hypothetical protein
MKRFFPLLAVIAGTAWVAATAQTSETGSFLAKLGRDTIAVEQYSMNARELRGTSIARSPQTTVRTYLATFGPNGALERFHVSYQKFGGPVTAERDFAYTDDSVRVTMKQDASTREYTAAAPGRPYPFFADLFGGWNAALVHAMRKGGTKQFAILSGRRIFRYEVQGTSPGALELMNPEGNFGPLYARIGKDGRLDRFDMTATTDKFVVQRVSRVNVEGMGRRFAERERAGHALGVLSPRDSVLAILGGAHVMVDYGRPSMRGRTIFGKVVPWNKVWRTGANAATQLKTDKELVFGTTRVPAGIYSLFTLPSQKGWMLIINRQHGQWGTVYDQSQDLARLPLKVTRLKNPVDRFTFDITERANQGVLGFKWERTEASIPFRVQ